FISKITFWDSLFDSKIPVSLNEVLYACIFGILLAFIFSVSIQNKWLNKFAKKIKISNKYGDEDLYMYFLNAKEIDWVWIRDEQNKYTYEGQVNTYSENEQNRELVLINVKVYPYDSKNSLYEVPILYLSFPKDVTFSIEVPNYDEENNDDKKNN
ncbi:hypothetical protein MUP95_04030, partial [bacterium]|nr:hypothetical protein [bacterium]